MLPPPGHDVACGRILDVELLAGLANAQSTFRDKIDELLPLLARRFLVEFPLLPSLILSEKLELLQRKISKRFIGREAHLLLRVRAA